MIYKLPQTDDFHSITIDKIPLIDLRSPIEYASGAFENSINLPLMSDEERHLVGICYKQKGNEKAVELGHELVSGDIKKARVDACIQFIQENPDTHIYCFRGGQRSEIMQKWLAEAGHVVPKLKGGYKAYRSYLMESTIEISDKQNIVILGGRTGSGKTLLLNKIENSIDLEGLANHRGSSFGNFSTPQPTQINFESLLSVDMIAHQEKGYSTLVLEDESKNVGRCFIPNEMYANMENSSVILLEEGLDRRVEITYDEYVIASQKEYLENEPDNPNAWIEQMQNSFTRILKRLGGEKHLELSGALESAWKYQLSSGDTARHKEWISSLLGEYYDPMYDYQIEKKRERVVFSGNEKDVFDFVSRNH